MNNTKNIIRIGLLCLNMLFLSYCNSKPQVNYVRTADILLDSCNVSYQDFDIKKDCFDCVPNFVCYFSINDDSLYNKAINRKVQLILRESSYADTFDFCLLDSLEKTFISCGKGLLFNYPFICGYYEQLRFGYQKIKSGFFYYTVDSVEQEIMRNPDFRINELSPSAEGHAINPAGSDPDVCFSIKTKNEKKRK